VSRLNKKWVIVVAAALVVAVLIVTAVVRLLPSQGGQSVPLPEIADNIQQTPETGPKLDIAGANFTEVAANGRIALAVNAAGQLQATDLKGGHEWLSSPSQEALQTEEVKGFWRNNLNSPFVIEYLDGNGISTEVVTANSEDLETGVSFFQLRDGVEIVYELQKIGIRFSYRVQLADDHLVVDVPYDRISETGSGKLVSLWVLPFFGAMQSATNTGYMFVPDGVGALIPFDPKTKFATQYTTQIYGNNISVSGQIQTEISNDNQEITADTLVPVFGIASGDKAFVSIIDKGEYTAKLLATPGGMYTTFNWVTPQFTYRQGYFKRTSLFGEGFRVFQDEMLQQDRRIRYYFLSGDQANYSGMASTYRQYLIEEEGLTRIEEASFPLNLALMGGDRKQALLGKKLVASTTFEQAREMVRFLYDEGIDDFDVTYMGWEKNGYLQDTPGRFPPSRELGGADGLSKLAEQVHQKGGRLYLSDNYNAALGDNQGFQPKYDAVRDLNGKVISENLGLKTTKYWIHPDLSWKMLNNNFEAYKTLDVDGLYFTGLGEAVFSDETASNRIPRETAGAIFGKMAQATREQLGDARVAHGNAYMFPYVDHIGSLPFDTSYDMLATETVPFLPIALHGLIAYSGLPLNVQDEAKIGFLKSVEYGALPSYLLTYDDPAELKFTLSRWIYSSQFEAWRDQISSEYKELKDNVGGLGNQLIANHRKVAAGVYETTYEGGTKVLVNYNKTAVTIDGEIIEPEDYAVVAKGGRQ
jgi:hypothetical protein